MRDLTQRTASRGLGGRTVSTHDMIDRLQEVRTLTRRWGTVRTLGPAHGTQLFFLEVHPPGTTSRDRRLIAIDRIAPAYGSSAGLLIAALIDGLPSWALLTSVLATAAAFGLVTRRLTRRLRDQTRSLTVEVNFRAAPSTTIDGNPDLLVSCHRALIALDNARTSEFLTPAEYERRWAEVYFRIPAISLRR
ncbi:hypothetical protein N864_19490 [Intrasporangium chromatireducens Q5-1]|uniref:Uncharacterized protein n=1 Tax=Intrasporangium chromatireducens Q5-1 TaxID=584657 RepID=W9GST3_9MICO|nr:hypothetical protein N864_19490 [Intrasporangium chromatireducens Q5-1]